MKRCIILVSATKYIPGARRGNSPLFLTNIPIFPHTSAEKDGQHQYFLSTFKVSRTQVLLI